MAKKLLYQVQKTGKTYWREILALLFLLVGIFFFRSERRELAARFRARDANLVLDRSAPEPIPFRVLLDGAPPGPSHGVDVDAEGAGVLRDGRLYQLVRQHDAVRERTLEITFPATGAEAYVFTFG